MRILATAKTRALITELTNVPVGTARRSSHGRSRRTPLGWVRVIESTRYKLDK